MMTINDGKKMLGDVFDRYSLYLTDDYREWVIHSFYETIASAVGRTPKSAFDIVSVSVIEEAYINAGYASIDDFHGKLSEEYWAEVPAHESVQVFYPEAVNDPEIMQAISDGSLSSLDLLLGIAYNATKPKPTLEDLRTGAGLPAPDLPDLPDEIVLVDAGLTFPGLSDQHLDFLIAMYIGSFGRAPEYDGLEYWAGEVVRLQSEGMEFGEIAEFLGGAFYYAGTLNGESGTDLATADFVTSAYRNLLDREPDAEGHAYWVGELDAGHVSRGAFMGTFVTAALENAADGAHVTHVVTVAEHIAQEHVSGSMTELDMALLGLINEIEGLESAAGIIEHIDATYPEAMAVGLSYDLGIMDIA